MEISSVILAKSKSKRLPNKNTLDYKGEPMFLTNVKKCVSIFKDTYVSSDSHQTLKEAESVGAIGILRGEDLCGDTPSVPVFQHAFQQMSSDIDGIISVQANSPQVERNLIVLVKKLMEIGMQEVMTCDKDYKIYGSIWGISKERLLNYGDPYKQKPDVLLLDTSLDIHTLSDYNKLNEK